MVTALIITAIFIIGLLVFGGRLLYLRSVRIRNRLQLEHAFTNIGHELLTPLTVISASVERLRNQAPDYNTDYTLMELNIDRMVHLLQELLETSKLQAGEMRLKVSQGDVMEYIRQTALCLEPLMSKRKLDFTIKCQPTSMMGWIDTDKLDKIIYNLLSNSAKYTKEGSVSLIAQTNKTYDHIIIKVSDTGIGLSPEQKKHLYQRFYDGDYRHMRTIGTGLGLPLMRDLVYLHGGTIECESEQGKGTVFTISLPINKEAFTPSQIDEEHPIEISSTPRTAILDVASLQSEEMPETSQPNPESVDENTYRILLVEDNIELLMLMQSLLSQKYYVHAATNGVEALKIVQTEDLDLIISDVMMPEMDGNELTKRIKSNPDTSHLPVVLLTAKTQEEDRKESLLIGADDYITKPFKMSDLEVRINNLIENRKRILREYLAQSAEEIHMKTSTAPTADEEFLKRATDCVYKHLDDSEFDRDAFAADMGASASTLYNKLRSLTGLNVSSFIRDIRMKEAKRLATTQPDLRISDLAYKVGFKDPKYFSTCFKKEFGIQPSEFIEMITTGQKDIPEKQDAPDQ